jgi:hypothetical protein
MRRLDDLQSSHQNFLMHFSLEFPITSNANKVANFVISLYGERRPCARDHFSSSRRQESQQTNRAARGLRKGTFLAPVAKRRSKKLWPRKGEICGSQRNAKSPRANKSRRAGGDSIFRFDSQRASRGEAAKRYYFLPMREHSNAWLFFCRRRQRGSCALLSTRVHFTRP